MVQLIDWHSLSFVPSHPPYIGLKGEGLLVGDTRDAKVFSIGVHEKVLVIRVDMSRREYCT